MGVCVGVYHLRRTSKCRVTVGTPNRVRCHRPQVAVVTSRLKVSGNVAALHLVSVYARLLVRSLEVRERILDASLVTHSLTHLVLQSKRLQLMHSVQRDRTVSLTVRLRVSLTILSL